MKTSPSKSLLGRMPRPCDTCMVGGPFGARTCPIRDAVRAETGADVRCVVCAVEPGPLTALLTDEEDRWYCPNHHPDLVGSEAVRGR